MSFKVILRHKLFQDVCGLLRKNLVTYHDFESRQYVYLNIMTFILVIMTSSRALIFSSCGRNGLP